MPPIYIHLDSKLRVYTPSRWDTTHQKCYVSVPKEVFVVSHKRSIGFQVRSRRFPPSTQLNYDALRLGLSGTKSFLDAWRSVECVGEHGTDREEGGCSRENRRDGVFVVSQRNYERCHGWKTEQEINVYSMQTATTTLCLPDGLLNFRFQSLGQGGELKRHGGHLASSERGEWI